MISAAVPRQEALPTDTPAFAPNEIPTAWMWTPTTQPVPMSPNEIIDTVNRMRNAHGLRSLIIDSILMRTAQTTSDTMASGHLTGHIGNARQRAIDAGYGAGDIPWITENFAVIALGNEASLWDAWADPLHMKPMADPNYQHIGVGVAEVEGEVYYLLHAGYTSNKIYKPNSIDLNSSPSAPRQLAVSEFIYPVSVATPGPDGKVVHKVLAGQSLWSIAIAYKVKIVEILRQNGIPQDRQVIQVGQNLRIPTPVGSVNPPVVAATRVAVDNRNIPEALLQPKTESKTAPARLDGSPTIPPVSENPSSKTDRIIGVVITIAFLAGGLGVAAGIIMQRRRTT